jgi:hypothetical protein
VSESAGTYDGNFEFRAGTITQLDEGEGSFMKKGKGKTNSVYLSKKLNTAAYPS